MVSIIIPWYLFIYAWYFLNMYHCVKSVRIQSYSGPYFPAFRLNTERYFVSLRILYEYGKIRTRITPNTDTFHAVYVLVFTRVECNMTNIFRASPILQFISWTFRQPKYEKTGKKQQNMRNKETYLSISHRPKFYRKNAFKVTVMQI